jgi:glycosyltransferase involved in cell wall biosynthesis
MNDLVCVLLSVHNGSKFLQAQLESLSAQTHRNWMLLWRDDGSQDDSSRIMEAFADQIGGGRVRKLAEPTGQLGITSSFLSLLASAPADAAFFAFCDQDDVWFADKLERAVGHFAEVPAQQAGLYCSRQMLVDAELRPIGMSPAVKRAPGLGNALVQNIATGCTIVINKEARHHILSAQAPDGTLHDYWSYLVVCAVSGSVYFDPEPSIFYRQHGGNSVGSQASLLRRALRALNRGPRPFLQGMSNNLTALSKLPGFVIGAKKIKSIAQGLQSRSPITRLRALKSLGLYRQAPAEDLLLRVWISVSPIPDSERSGAD